MNIVTEFYRVARESPDRLSIIDSGKEVSYATLLNKVQTTVDGYRNMGLNKGDAILLLIPVSISFYVHLLAAFAFGLKVVLVDQVKPVGRIEFAIEKIGVNHIITNRWLKFACYYLLRPKYWGRVNVVKRSGHSSTVADMKETDTALITLTSGTTGEPKAADRSHGFLQIQLETLAKELDLANRKIHLSSFPVVLLCNLAFGVTSVLPNTKRFGFFSPRKGYPAGIDLISGSPFYIDAFRESCSIKNASVFIGGATILPHFLETLSGELSLRKTRLIYGSTEAEPISILDGIDYMKNNEGEAGICVGSPHPRVSVRIRSQDKSGILEAEHGEVGEILVAGPHVLDRYFGDSEVHRKNKISEGGMLWHRTGDAGYLRDGKLYYLGRIKWLKMLEDNRVFSPTIIEKIFSEKMQTHATMLYIKGKFVLFTEDHIAALPDLPFRVDEVIEVGRFKRDKRHRSRIDYTYLERMVN